MKFHHRRRDANQKAIAAAFESHGCSVAVLSDLGNGICDLLVAKRGVTFLAEVKDGSKPPSDCNLTPAEAEFMSRWKGIAIVVYNEAGAENALKALRLLK